jgi:hypothetical protein
MDLHVLDGGDERDLGDAGNVEQDDPTGSKRITKIYEQFFLDIIEEAPNRKSVQDGSYLSIPACMRNELAWPELLQTADLLFTKVQYRVCTDAQWTMHFNRFFPTSIETAKRQNFGRCTYHADYMALCSVITKKSLLRAPRVLRVEFDKLAWVPFTQSDHMWTTGKMTGSAWTVLENSGGPAIGINPRRQREPVTLRIFDLPQGATSGSEEEEEEEE